MKTFEDLKVYQHAFEFTVDIFSLTRNPPLTKNIANQLERASLSISNNIAEGFESQSNRQFIRFLYVAKGSCGECRNLLAVANRLNQIDSQLHEKLKRETVGISKQLSNFIKYLRKSGIE